MNPNASVYDDEDALIDQARETLDAHEHALAKIDHLVRIGVSRQVRRAAERKAEGDATAKIQYLRHSIARAEFDRDGGGRKWTDEEIDRLINRPKKQLARAIEQRKRLQKSEDKRQTLNAVDVAQAVESGTEYRDARVTPSAAKSKSPGPGVAKTREAIEAEKKKRLGTYGRSYRGEEDYLAALRPQIKQLAAKGAPDFALLAGRNIDVNGHEVHPKVRWPVAFEGSGYTILEGLPVIARYFPERIEADALAYYRRVVKPERVLSDTERKAKLAEIDRTILALEREEEALVELCEAQGIDVLRRPDASPFAVLGIEPVGATNDDEADDNTDFDFG